MDTEKGFMSENQQEMFLVIRLKSNNTDTKNAVKVNINVQQTSCEMPKEVVEKEVETPQTMPKEVPVPNSGHQKPHPHFRCHPGRGRHQNGNHPHHPHHAHFRGPPPHAAHWHALTPEEREKHKEARFTPEERARWAAMSQEERQAVKAARREQRLARMSPAEREQWEERKQEREQRRQEWANMTPAEKAARKEQRRQERAAFREMHQAQHKFSSPRV